MSERRERYPIVVMPLFLLLGREGQEKTEQNKGTTRITTARLWSSIDGGVTREQERKTPSIDDQEDDRKDQGRENPLGNK